MIMVIVKSVMKARDFLFARKHARPNVMTLQIVANTPLVCMPTPGPATTSAPISTTTQSQVNRS